MLIRKLSLAIITAGMSINFSGLKATSWIWPDKTSYKHHWDYTTWWKNKDGKYKDMAIQHELTGKYLMPAYGPNSEGDSRFYVGFKLVSLADHKFDQLTYNTLLYQGTYEGRRCNLARFVYVSRYNKSTAKGKGGTDGDVYGYPIQVDTVDGVPTSLSTRWDARWAAELYFEPAPLPGQPNRYLIRYLPNDKPNTEHWYLTSFENESKFVKNRQDAHYYILVQQEY